MLTIQNIARIQSPNNSSGKIRAVRSTLFHINGEESEIVMLIPRYTDWMEYMEEAQFVVREYVGRLTRHWVQITRFETSVGTFDQDGKFELTFGPVVDQIPLNKVYARGNTGEWVDPNQHPHFPNYGTGELSRDLQELVKIVSERKEEVYHNIDDLTTLCGVPASSKDFYFFPGEIPKSTFLYNGREYLTVYQFIKTTGQSQKGGSSCA